MPCTRNDTTLLRPTGLRWLFLLSVAALILTTLPPACAQTNAGLSLAVDADTLPAGRVLHLIATGTPGSGNVTFLDGSTPIAVVPRDATTGTAALGVATLARGVHALTATGNGATSNALAVTVTGLPAPFSITGGVASLLPGAPLPLTAVGLPTDATGMLTFSDAGNALATTTVAGQAPPAYTAFGDSITAGAGVADPRDAFPALLAHDLGLTLTDLAASGLSGCDVLTFEVMKHGVDPTQMASSLFTLMIGTNDAWNTAELGTFHLCHQAVMAWLGTPREYKVLAGDAAVTATSGTWSYNGAGPANNVADATYRTLYNSSGSGSARVSLTTSGGPAYLWYFLDNLHPALFTVSLDGVPTGVTYGVAPPEFLVSTLGPSGSGFALLRLPMTAGAHTLDVTLMAGTLGILGAGTPPSPAAASVHPTVVVSDLTNENTTCARDTAVAIDTYSQAAFDDARLMAGDGLDIRTVTTRDLMAGSPAEMADCIHPNALGNRHLADAFERTLNGLATAPYAVPVAHDVTASATLAGVGAHTLVATYSGDGRYAASQSAPMAVQVTDPTTHVVLTTPSSHVAYNTPVLLTATLQAAAGGVFHFYDQTGTDTGNAYPEPASGSLTFHPRPGHHVYIVSYESNDFHTNSTSEPVAVDVAGDATSLTMTASTAQLVHGQPIHLAAQLSLTGCNGTLTFSDASAGPLGWVYVSRGVGALDVPLLAGGVRSLSVAYTGDAICAPSVSAPVSVHVDPIPASIVITSPAGSTFHDPVPLHVDILAAVTPAMPMLTGTLDAAFNQTTIFMGDSITYGWTMPVHNAGIIGQTVGDMLQRFPINVVGHGFERVHILAGTNDILHTQHDTGTIIAGIRAMAGIADDAGIRPILCTILPMVVNGIDQAARVDPLNAAIAALAQEKNYVLVDYHTAMMAHRDLIGDGVHPDGRGHDVMQTALTRTLLVPTGTVSLPDGTTATLSATGTATLVARNLSGGQQAFHVDYHGDESFMAKAVPLSLQINPAATLVTLHAEALVGHDGTAAALATTVSSPAGAPTGSVSFFDGSTLIGTTPLLPDGQALLHTASLPNGTHPFTATFLGNDDYRTSSSAPAPVNVVFAATMLTVSSTASSFRTGDPIAITATVVPSSATGTVTLLEGSRVVGQVALLGGTAIVSAGSLPVGPHTLTATYAGDSFDAPAQSVALNLTVTTIPTTLILAGLPPSAVYGSPLTVTATVTPATTNGPVLFTDSFVAAGQSGANSQALGQAAIANGVASLALPALGIGTHTISAHFAGDPSTQPATAAALSLTVSPIPSAIVLSAPGVSAPAGRISFGSSALVFTATVAPASSTGNVNLTDALTGVSTQAVLSSGKVAFSLGSLSTGTHTFTAVYAGDALDTASTSQPFSLTVDPVTTTLTLAPLPAMTLPGQVLTLTASVTPANATGSVIFRDATAGTLGQASIVQGIATLALNNLAVGVYNLGALYGGDRNDSPSNSAVLSTQVGLRPTTTSVSGVPASVAFGTDVQVTATVVPASATGLVTLTDNGSPLGTALLLHGSASVHVAALAVGPHLLVASYAGDGSNGASSTPGMAFAVTPDNTSTALTLAQASVPAGAPVIVNVTVASALNAVPTGVVTLRASTGAGSSVVASASLAHASAGSAYVTFTLDSLKFGLGSFRLAASYSGDPVNALSDSGANPAVLTVVPSPTTATLSLSAPIVPVQATVTLTAQINAVSGTIPTGTIAFLNGTQTLATAPVSATGSASLSLPAGTLGTWAVTAVYTPTTFFAGSSAPVQTLTVTPPVAIAIATPVLSVAVGGATADTVTLTPLSGYRGGVALRCTSPVSFITCSVNGPGQLTSATDTTLHITVNKTLSQRALNIPSGAGLPGTFLPGTTLPLTCALVLLPFASRRRIRSIARAALLLLALGIAATAATGCGTGGNFNSIPTGPQVLTVTATAAGVTLTSGVTVTITP